MVELVVAAVNWWPCLLFSLGPPLLLASPTLVSRGTSHRA